MNERKSERKHKLIFLSVNVIWEYSASCKVPKPGLFIFIVLIYSRDHRQWMGTMLCGALVIGLLQTPCLNSVQGTHSCDWLQGQSRTNVLFWQQNTKQTAVYLLYKLTLSPFCEIMHWTKTLCWSELRLKRITNKEKREGKKKKKSSLDFFFLILFGSETQIKIRCALLPCTIEQKGLYLWIG